MGSIIYPLFLLSLLSHVVFASVTVSGISSGGAFAHQFHVAHSSFVSGAGIVAGIPYYCAEDNVVSALSCMSSPDTIILDDLIDATSYALSMGSIDDTTNIAQSKVYLYSGANDTVVSPGTMQKLEKYYLNYMHSSSIKTVFNISSEHAFITNDYGSNCTFMGSPFINNCNYDQAGDILSYLYGSLDPAVTPIDSNIVTIGQSKFVPSVVSLTEAGLGDTAFIYVPDKCSSSGSGCRVHISFHGCEQTVADINTTFVMQAGYNQWAESNSLVVLYPQAKRTDLNPKGCWDWWGYTGEDYASQLGVRRSRPC